MLSASERDIVERDRALPGLSTLLDPEAFAAILRPALPDVEFTSVRRTYLRYKPFTNCLATYRLEAPGTELDVYAKAHGRDVSLKLAKARERNTGLGRIFCQEKGLAVYLFPDDGKLPVLSRFSQTDARVALLRRMFPDDPELWTGTVETLGYKPERRYVGKLLAGGEPRAVLKLYTETGHGFARRNLIALRSRSVLRVPERIATFKAHRIVATGWIPGDLLSEAIPHPDFDASTLTRVGSALAELHQQDPREWRVEQRSARCAALAALGDVLCVVAPELGQQARDLGGRLTARLAQQPATHRPIHGDFYAKQVLLDSDGEHVGVLDFDAALRGDPAADLGLFLAHLERDVLRGITPAGRLEPLRAALLAGYRMPTGHRLEIELYTAIGLLELVHHPFRHCEPDWLERTAALLDRAEAAYQSIPARVTSVPSAASAPVSHAPISVIDPADMAGDPGMPFLRGALDPQTARSELEASVFPGRGLQLNSIQAGRHVPGRRALVEYELELTGASGGRECLRVLGKCHARRLDTRTYHLVDALYQSGFGVGGASDVSVPEPIGIVPAFRMWLQRWVPGESGEQVLLQTDDITTARKIAQAAHQLHQTEVYTSRRHDIGDELRILNERLQLVSEARPSWEKRLHRVLGACERLAGRLPVPNLTGIHRDFYPRQILVDGERIVLVDFDLFCQGDPALDIGNFAGHLIELGLRVPEAAQRLERHRIALELEFLSLAGEKLRDGLLAYTTLTLVRHVHISTLFRERRAFTERLLDLCEARLAGEGVL